MFDDFIDFEFCPSEQRAKALNHRMQRELGESLKHICDQTRETYTYDESGMTRLINELIGGKSVSPGTFGRYYELVNAINEEDTTRVETLFSELVAAPFLTDGTEIVSLGDERLGAESDKYLKIWEEDQVSGVMFERPTPELVIAFEGRLQGGMALLKREIPELYAEIFTIVRQVIIVGCDETLEYQFDGGSHYQLWGALFLNGHFHPDDIAVAEVLSHESAHSLLFGFCIDEPLTLNDDDELFASPLRADKRPMDGIYHATFVSARMHWAMSKLAQSSTLTDSDRARASEAAATDLKNFNAGYGVIAEHARLTDTGERIMAAAKAHIDAYC